MQPHLSAADRLQVLRFAASFLWADLKVADSERSFLGELARELDVDEAHVAPLLSRPPTPEEIDPTDVAPRVADLVRRTVLRAIASDGQVADAEMTMFELLDDLLPPSATLQ